MIFELIDDELGGLLLKASSHDTYDNYYHVAHLLDEKRMTTSAIDYLKGVMEIMRLSLKDAI